MVVQLRPDFSDPRVAASSTTPVTAATTVLNSGLVATGPNQFYYPGLGNFSIGGSTLPTAITGGNTSDVFPVSGNIGLAGSQSGDALSKLADLITKATTTIPAATVPPLGYTPPTSSEIDAKWKEFLDKASKDPDIVNYYQKLLDQAKGDTAKAKEFLERDYQMGTRQTQENLKASLESLGLTFTKERETLQDTLNKRGIALTQADSGKLMFAGGGRSATELGQLSDSQRLRQEAEERTARQKVEGLGMAREKGLWGAESELARAGLDITKAKETDIAQRAQTYQSMWQAKQSADLLRAQIEQQKQMQAQQAGGGVGGGNRPGGDPNIMTQEQKQSLWEHYGHPGISPVGYGGG